MNDDFDGFISYLIVFIFGFSIGTLLFIGGRQRDIQQHQKEAISLGHAQYNPTNGFFEWKPIK